MRASSRVEGMAALVALATAVPAGGASAQTPPAPPAPPPSSGQLEAPKPAASGTSIRPRGVGSHPASEDLRSDPHPRALALGRKDDHNGRRAPSAAGPRSIPAGSLPAEGHGCGGGSDPHRSRARA